MRCWASVGNFIKQGFQSLFQQGHYAACDGMRALAMTWVICHHCCEQTTFPLVEKLWWPVSLLRNGGVAVDIFFALSGFLLGSGIYEEYLKSGSIKFWAFFVKRWFRIAPAYISVMLADIIIDYLHGSRSVCLYAWSNLLFVNNIQGFSTFCVGQGWSIAVEFQLYMVTPLLFAAAWCLSKNDNKGSFVVTALVLSSLVWLLCCLIRFEYASQNFIDSAPKGQVESGATWPFKGSESISHWDMPYTSTLYRMAPYAAGLCGGVAMKETKRQGSSGSDMLQLTLMSLSLLTIAFAALFGAEQSSHPAFQWWANLCQGRIALVHTVLLRPCVGLAISYLLFLCAVNRAPRLNSFLGARFWTPLAGLSYSMYLLQFDGFGISVEPLYHNFIQGWLQGKSDAVVVAVSYFLPIIGFVATLPLALANYLLVERSGIMLSKRLLAPSTVPAGTEASKTAKEKTAERHLEVDARPTQDDGQAVPEQPTEDLEAGPAP